MDHNPDGGEWELLKLTKRNRHGGLIDAQAVFIMGESKVSIHFVYLPNIKQWRLRAKCDLLPMRDVYKTMRVANLPRALKRKIREVYALVVLL